MKIYIHDYTKVAAAGSHLYAAQQLNAHDDPIEAWKHIEDARQFLQEYLAQENMVIYRDAGGLIKAEDTFDEHQLAFIRDEFACIMERTNNANGELDIINKCCRLLEDPEFESFEEFEKNNSGTWAEKYIPEEDEP